MTTTNKPVKARKTKFTTSGGNVLTAVEFIGPFINPSEALRNTGVFHVEHNGERLRGKVDRHGRPTDREWSITSRSKGCYLSPIAVTCRSYKEALEIVARHCGIA